MELFFALPLFVLYCLMGMVFVATTIWAYFDAESRGKSGCLVALIVFFLAWPLGLILWLVVRPERIR